MMLMMPEPPPEASYLADGLVMTSTLSMASAGIWSRERVVGRPSTKMVGEAPRRLTLPSMSTLTEGTLRMTSCAVPPALTMFLSTLNTFFSMSRRMAGVFAVTVTVLSSLVSVVILMIPRSLLKDGRLPMGLLLSLPGAAAACWGMIIKDRSWGL